MARIIKDSNLQTRAARDRLPPQKKPHWKVLVPSALHLGYRRRKRDRPGQWLVRHYLGDERYHIAPLGTADDFQEGDDVVTFAEAQRAARLIATHGSLVKRPRSSMPSTPTSTTFVRSAPPPPTMQRAAPPPWCCRCSASTS